MPINAELPKTPSKASLINSIKPPSTAPISHHSNHINAKEPSMKANEREHAVQNPDPITNPSTRTFPRINSSSKAIPIPAPPAPESIKQTFHTPKNPLKKSHTQIGNESPDAIEDMMKSINPQSYSRDKPPKK